MNHPLRLVNRTHFIIKFEAKKWLFQQWQGRGEKVDEGIVELCRGGFFADNAASRVNFFEREFGAIDG